MSSATVRLSDVARAAGTSTKTASRVINGDPRVAASTRRRVEEQVALLGYRVDVMARTLRRGVDDTVGVMVPTIGDPFFATFIEEVERIALDRAISVLVASNSRDAASERRIVDGLLARRVAGMIITPFETDFAFLTAVRTPAVFLDRHPRGLERGAVVVDDFAEGRRATRHLIAHGHTRIALVVDDLSIETSHLRRQGYLAALEEAGIAIEPQIQLIGCSDAAVAEMKTRQLLSMANPPTAIFSARSETSLGVVRALHLGHRTDIALVSFGDFAMADILDPAITVLDHNPRILARVAMDRLMSLMDGDGRSDDGDDVVDLHLITRGSGELAPQSSEAVA